MSAAECPRCGYEGFPPHHCYEPRPCPNCSRPLSREHIYDFATQVCSTFPAPRPSRRSPLTEPGSPQAEKGDSAGGGQ